MTDTNLSLYKDFEKHDRGVDEGKRMASNGILVMAHHLKIIRDEKLFKAQGDDGQNTWASYCGGKGINPNTANKYISIYTFYIEEMGKKPEEISEMSIDTLGKYQAAMVKATPEKREELFEVMKGPLSLSDKHKMFVDEKLAKPHWLIIKTCEGCKKYEIHYDQDAVCNCKCVAIYARPIL